MTLSDSTRHKGHYIPDLSTSEVFHPPTNHKQVSKRGYHTQDPDAYAQDKVGHEVLARRELIWLRGTSHVGR